MSQTIQETMELDSRLTWKQAYIRTEMVNRAGGWDSATLRGLLDQVYGDAEEAKSKAAARIFWSFDQP